ncbi:hypothetical protein Hypma_012123 [Hypsizygus marmoreus]|uniref:Uncharacterized protein n=1 Tax=Hypsizygus marmoreus TaxID=39966 RepID=A0A369JEW0_HYPMA|nr:hypothetical protein Hypma_012123 [Hypsizygus marmoreus]
MLIYGPKLPTLPELGIRCFCSFFLLLPWAGLLDSAQIRIVVKASHTRPIPSLRLLEASAEHLDYDSGPGDYGRRYPSGIRTVESNAIPFLATAGVTPARYEHQLTSTSQPSSRVPNYYLISKDNQYGTCNLIELRSDSCQLKNLFIA